MRWLQMFLGRIRPTKEPVPVHADSDEQTRTHRSDDEEFIVTKRMLNEDRQRLERLQAEAEFHTVRKRRRRDD